MASIIVSVAAGAVVLFLSIKGSLPRAALASGAGLAIMSVTVIARQMLRLAQPRIDRLHEQQVAHARWRTLTEVARASLSEKGNNAEYLVKLLESLDQAEHIAWQRQREREELAPSPPSVQRVRVTADPISTFLRST